MLPDATDFVKLIKKAAIEAQDSTNPVQFCFGKVESIKPLIINVEQKLRLGEAQLILSRNVTDYVTMATVQWSTEKSSIKHNHNIDITDNGGDEVKGSTEYAEVFHEHDIEGTKQITIHNALEKNETVILLRQQGGQKYLVLDRIG